MRFCSFTVVLLSAPSSQVVLWCPLLDTKFLMVVYMMFEATGKYVEIDSLKRTTPWHSHDSTFKRFHALRWYVMCSCIFRVPIRSQIPDKPWEYGSVCETLCVGDLCWLESGISQWLKHFGGSWKHKNCETHVYNRKFEWSRGVNRIVLVVRQNMCGVSSWTCIRHISVNEELWRKLSA
jgi:hypothetical protein